jgi:hypothetical protein
VIFIRNVFVINVDQRKAGHIVCNQTMRKLIFVSSKDAQMATRTFETIGEVAEWLDDLRDAGHDVLIEEVD